MSGDNRKRKNEEVNQLEGNEDTEGNGDKEYSTEISNNFCKLQKLTDENDQDTSNKRIPLKKIISGGQVGADMGGLLAGKRMKIETGGTAPRGFMTVNGRNQKLQSEYQLTELNIRGKKSLSQMYVLRSRCYVEDSDGTIAFRYRKGPGTDKSIGFALTKVWKYPGKEVNCSLFGELVSQYKPVFIVNPYSDIRDEEIVNWIVKNNIRVLNVIGHRDENHFDQLVSDILYRMLSPYLVKSDDDGDDD